MKKIFVTGKLSPKVIHDSEGIICTFQNAKDNIIPTSMGLILSDNIENKWFIVLNDEDKIRRMEALPGFGTVIKEASSEPFIGASFNLKQTIGTSTESEIKVQANKMSQRQISDAKESMKKDWSRYGILSRDLCKPGGGYYAAADPLLVKEFEELKIKLDIQEEEVKNETVS